MDNQSAFKVKCWRNCLICSAVEALPVPRRIASKCFTGTRDRPAIIIRQCLAKSRSLPLGELQQAEAAMFFYFFLIASLSPCHVKKLGNSLVGTWLFQVTESHLFACSQMATLCQMAWVHWDSNVIHQPDAMNTMNKMKSMLFLVTEQHLIVFIMIYCLHLFWLMARLKLHNYRSNFSIGPCMTAI